MRGGEGGRGGRAIGRKVVVVERVVGLEVGSCGRECGEDEAFEAEPDKKN